MPFARAPLLLTTVPAAVFLAACSTAAPRVPAQTATVKIAPVEQAALQTPQARAEFHVMAGELAAGRHQPRAAAEQFLAALDDIPDPQLAARATGLAVGAKDDALGLKIAQRWLAISPQSGRAREVLVRLGLRQKQTDLVVEQCRAIIDDQADGRAQGYRIVAQLLSQEPEAATESAKVMQTLVADDAKNPSAHEAAALLALHSEDIAHAESEARAALALKPGDKDASLLLTAALVRQDRLDDADAVMDDITRGAHDPAALRIGYAQLLMQNHREAHARDQLNALLKQHPHDDDARFLLALVDLNGNDLDGAEQALKGMHPAPGDNRYSDVQFYLGRIAEARGDGDAALRHYKNVTQGNQVITALLRRAVLLGRLGRLDDAESLLRQASENYPQLDDELIVTQAQIYLDANMPQNAAALLERALQVQPGDANLLYMRSLAYEKLGRITDAEADLRQILAQAPNDPRALNGLGYMLTEHNADKLDEAHDLIAKALKMTPDDPAVIDSMGWVLFRQGHPDQALPLLRKAYDLLNDPEVAAHLATVMAALGDHDKAQALLQQALKQHPSDPTLQQAADKLNQ